MLPSPATCDRLIDSVDRLDVIWASDVNDIAISYTEDILNTAAGRMNTYHLLFILPEEVHFITLITEL